MTFAVRPDQLTREQLLAACEVAGDEPWQVVARLLGDRYSCRGFTAEPVPRETIERLLALAQLAPSWCNSQPWQVIVTEGEGTRRFRESLHAHAAAHFGAQESDFPFPAQYAGVHKTRRFETAGQLFDCVGVRFGDRVASRRQALENFRLFGAPHLLLITSEQDLGTYGAIDCGIYLAGLMLLAQGMGIATIPQAALARYSSFIRRYFGLPDNRLVVCGLSFGREDRDHPANRFRTTRAPAREVVTWRSD